MNVQQPPVRDDLAAMVGYHSPQVDVSVRLNTNESPQPPPEGFRQAVTEAVASLDWHRYPHRGAEPLRRAIADLHDVDIKQVFAANGSNEVLQTLMLTYGGPGRRVVTFEPTYALHSHIATVVGTEVVKGERDHQFRLDADHAAEVVTEAKPIITFLCSPNNPTGLAEDPAVVDRVLEAVIATGGLLVVDEAYAEFASWTSLGRVDDSLPLIVTRTFSKTWSMAAARLGYMVGPSWVTDKLEAVVLPYHLDAVTQAAGLAALDFADEMNERVAGIVRERERILAAFDRLPIERWNSQSNFILFRPTEHDGQAVWQALLDHDVLVRNCATWPGLDGCLRVTIGTAEENDVFLAALAEILGDPSVQGVRP